MLEAIARAERSIHLEMYTFADDFIGRRFADALASRAADGLQANLLYDAAGSYNFDHLSLIHNHELTAILLDEGFGREVEAMFEDDFARSIEVGAAAWKGRGWGRRLLEDFFHTFRFLF